MEKNIAISIEDGKAPLPQDLFEQLCEEIKRWKSSSIEITQLLEDAVQHPLARLEACLYDPEAYHSTPEKLKENLSLTGFYMNVLIRYFQQKYGHPKFLQTYHRYDAPYGNQIDIFLDIVNGLL